MAAPSILCDGELSRIQGSNNFALGNATPGRMPVTTRDGSVR